MQSARLERVVAGVRRAIQQALILKAEKKLQLVGAGEAGVAEERLRIEVRHSGCRLRS